MKNLNLFLAGLIFILAGCKPEPSEDSSVKTYDVHGIMRQIAPDRRSATIQHDAIAGYMPGMTMDFNVRDTNELNGLSAGDEITFRLMVTETNSWIENVHFVAHQIEKVTNNEVLIHVASDELEQGDVLPDYELMAESGKRIHFSDFHGKALAFTFFFTRCPLPDYCPRMNRNFEEAREMLLADTNAPANWQLLSISFDPEFDSPEVLANYAGLYRGTNADHWLFAAASTNTLAQLAPRVDLMVMRQSATISHNMRTVVLDPNGKIFCQFDGNAWTPEQLADAIKKAARVQP
ncbi:MAG TPA: SCO family protein [Verrucomicrobiae bacterium]|nr:SCO family protein [Verrucomicrobiae bacterium]